MRRYQPVRRPLPSSWLPRTTLLRPVCMPMRAAEAMSFTAETLLAVGRIDAEIGDFDGGRAGLVPITEPTSRPAAAAAIRSAPCRFERGAIRTGTSAGDVFACSGQGLDDGPGESTGRWTAANPLPIGAAARGRGPAGFACTGFGLVATRRPILGLGLQGRVLDHRHARTQGVLHPPGLLLHHVGHSWPSNCWPCVVCGLYCPGAK